MAANDVREFRNPYPNFNPTTAVLQDGEVSLTLLMQNDVDFID